LRTIIDRLWSKLNRTVRRGVAYTLAASVVAVFGLPAAAMAEDDYYWQCGESYISCQTGVTAGLVEGQCETASAAFASTSVCVDYSGDYVYVRDGKADGFAAMAQIIVDEGSVYTRFCRNNHGYGTWVRCNFNWAEAGYHQALGGYKISSHDMEFDWLWSWYDN